MKTKEKTELELPKWFDGVVYKEGGEVTNPFSGQSAMLNNKELSMYDLILGAERFKHYDIMSKGLTWFRRSNGDAYMTLLD